MEPKALPPVTRDSIRNGLRPWSMPLLALGTFVLLPPSLLTAWGLFLLAIGIPPLDFSLWWEGFWVASEPGPFNLGGLSLAGPAAILLVGPACLLSLVAPIFLWHGKKPLPQLVAAAWWLVLGLLSLVLGHEWLAGTLVPFALIALAMWADPDRPWLASRRGRS